MLVTAETATFPLPFEIRALFAVKFAEAIVVAAPVIVFCLALNLAIPTEDKLSKSTLAFPAEALDACSANS